MNVFHDMFPNFYDQNRDISEDQDGPVLLPY